MPPKKCELVLLLTQLDSLLRVRQAWTLSEKSQASVKVILGSIVAATNYCILVYHCNIQELWHTNISVVHQSLIKDIRIQLPKNGKTWRGPGRSIHEPGDRVIVEGDIDCQLPPVGPEPWRWNDHKANSSLVHPGPLKISGLAWYFSTFSTLLLWIPLALLYSMISMFYEPLRFMIQVDPIWTIFEKCEMCKHRGKKPWTTLWPPSGRWRYVAEKASIAHSATNSALAHHRPGSEKHQSAQPFSRIARGCRANRCT